MKYIFNFILIFMFNSALAANDTVVLEKAYNEPDDKDSLQRGARNFMNYCSGCHSLEYIRYSTIADGLGISEEELMQNLMFNAAKPFEKVRSSMPPEQASKWFGVAPPDLTLMARAKGTDYIFTFLKGFYIDPNSPTGVDNVVLEGTSMPHVLWELQGLKRSFEGLEEHSGDVDLEFLTTGKLSVEEYDQFIRDTVNFLEYVSEPIRSTRENIGFWVLMFLFFFLMLSYLLKKEIWKDV
jgi:ubiquinol-cytochrome c reductase cytochrome c1 subunit|tara:strand:- start:5435 stop:6151 length:717 start_codon:yes stop_codon:yes gene_type:complete